MNTAVTKILNQLTGASSLHDVDVQSIGAIAAKYPWFGPAHLLVAQKLHAISPAEAVSADQKTALYFSNPYWLHFLLTEPAGYGIIDVAEKISAETTDAENLVENIVKESKQPFLNTNIKEEPEEFPLDEEDKLSAETREPDELRLSTILEQQAAEFRKPVEPETELPIKGTPLYTIDYFASQGIHIESIKAGRNQALDNKVKKFTDWLKQMKTANPQPTDLGTDEETEHVIEAIAQNSNETKDIITEAMAEVLIKQGKTNKAVQLYQKLSFLNPDKSAYFAAKIDKIKGN